MSQEITAALVKRHAHDLRNFLNGIEMDLTLLSESTDAKVRPAAVKRMRQELRRAEAMIRCFAAKFAVEKKAPHTVADIAEQWMADARSLLPEASIVWDVRAGNAVLHIEHGRVRGALDELIVLASRKCPRLPLAAGCAVDGGRAIFSVSCAQASGSRKNEDSLDSLVWASLQDLASQSGGVLADSRGPDQGHFGCRLVFPTAPHEPSFDVGR